MIRYPSVPSAFRMTSRIATVALTGAMLLGVSAVAGSHAAGAGRRCQGHASRQSPRRALCAGSGVSLRGSERRPDSVRPGFMVDEADARLGDVHVVLLSHAHNDHVGSRRDRGGTCAAPTMGPANANSNVATIAAAKNAVVMTANEAAAFLSVKIQNVRGVATPVCPMAGFDDQTTVPMSAPCTAPIGVSGSRHDPPRRRVGIGPHHRGAGRASEQHSRRAGRRPRARVWNHRVRGPCARLRRALHQRAHRLPHGRHRALRRHGADHRQALSARISSSSTSALAATAPRRSDRKTRQA